MHVNEGLKWKGEVTESSHEDLKVKNSEYSDYLPVHCSGEGEKGVKKHVTPT